MDEDGQPLRVYDPSQSADDDALADGEPPG